MIGKRFASLASTRLEMLVTQFLNCIGVMRRSKRCLGSYTELDTHCWP